MNNSKIITVDGPSGVGKGTLSKKLAKYFDYKLLDSGAIYRIAALHCYNAGANLDNQDDACSKLESLDISFKVQNDSIIVLLNNADVTKAIRTEQTGMLASKTSAYPKVRQMLHDKMLSFATDAGLVADGRDMGTVVFPDAKYKFFLDASSEVRAQRRYDELLTKGEGPNFDKIKNDIEQRDFQDRNRKVAPLKPADDAILVDTSNLSIEEVFQKVLNHINNL
ncbi:(d)CMP kinase [Francisella noatunensis]|uniref:Cytidylate kinase n=1 Tax=Francisella noatunensis TaxID=657445 RepID=A0A9Q2QCB1_9GAMM|nr:(d)CMP kinase [Francisella noatunensis]MBK2029354.1 (d)CMP kinase [Francisella noatunensis]MBK2033584.1 (d)CMP kinase [Francisella noatunensis]MBK2048156.1 (d)CMP kinase [Francisella noatunensis]MBK2050863.1 (d)CMP kinase [Francisella noatunensis]MBK2051747.1 (d)CMP kinase [Francisella noatunensis]